MILTVTLNTALDVTYDVDALVPNGTHRVREVHTRAGGKGLNVASVLRAMEVPVIATGLVGGPTGDLVVADLDARGIPHDFVAIHGDSRRTVTIVSAASGDATIFSEAGPLVSAEEWSAALATIGSLVADHDATVVALSGSLPRGVPDTAYAQLVLAARDQGALTVVDAGGAVLAAAVRSHPDVVKPNLAELAAATGHADVIGGAAALRALGARDVVVSAGGDGVTVLTADGRVLGARPRQRLRGNPTGAGDAMVAAICAGLAEGDDWPATLAEAAAWSAAAVLQPLAGELDPADVARLRDLGVTEST
ncbi:MAG: hexose kinase [Lapillicoccus sp.]